MLKRCLAILGLGATIVLGLNTSPGIAEGPPVPTAWVSVQYDVPARHHLTIDGRQPTLDERGFRSVPVPPGTTTAEFLEQLRRDPEVISAEAGGGAFAAALPDDGLYFSRQSSYLEPIGAPAAWDIATGRPEVVVAVLDTGLDLSHPEFEGRLWENPADADGDGIDDDGNGCIDDRYGCRFLNLTQSRLDSCGYTSSDATGAVFDDHKSPLGQQHSHGTLVSGVIAAAGNNNKGMTGVAWNVRIMTVKVLDCGTPLHGGQPFGAMTDIAEGIDYARRMGADVINLSLSAPDQASDIRVLREAIQAAENQGIIIVAAAGNYGSSSSPGPGYPAAYTQFNNVIAVGASDNKNGNTWASYSAYGPAVDFAAPGEDIVGTTRTDLGSYGTDRGTSFSAPLVSGMFALLMSRNSGLSANEYIQIARQTATPAPAAPHGQNWAGSGIINIGAAVHRVPMSLGGSPQHDWMDVPAGTEVRATVDGIECGATTAFAFGPVVRYSLRVKAATESPGCGSPNKTVQVLIGGTPAVPGISWGGQNANLNVVKDLSSVSPPPGPVVVQELAQGWSNVAHFDAPGTLPGALSYLPNNWSAALLWDPDGDGIEGKGRYLRNGRSVPAFASDWKQVQTYDAYWVDAQATTVANANPYPKLGRAIALRPGWNNFVYTGESRAVAEALEDVTGKYSQVLHFDNATGTWKSFLPAGPRFLNDFGGLLHLQVYWVFMTSEGTLVMD